MDISCTTYVHIQPRISVDGYLKVRSLVSMYFNVLIRDIFCKLGFFLQIIFRYFWKNIWIHLHLQRPRKTRLEIPTKPGKTLTRDVFFVFSIIWNFFDQILAKNWLKKLQKMTTILVFHRVPGFVGISNLVFRVLREFTFGSKKNLIRNLKFGI